MKKLIAIILTLTFVLTLAPLTLSVSADTQQLNKAGTSWTSCRSDNSFVVDSSDDYEFHVLADANGKTYDWPVYHKDSLEEGTIEATFGAKANIGIFFGATGIKDYVGDSAELVAGTDQAKDSLGTVKYDVRYYVATVMLEEKDGSPIYRFRLQADGDAASGSAPSQGSKDLTEADHGINGTDEFTMKISFNEEGDLKCYINGVLVMTKEDITPYGDEFGICVRRYEKYGTDYNKKEVGYVKNFSYSDTDFFNDWTPRRGASAVHPSAKGEIMWNSQNTDVWSNPIRYNKDLEEGTITAKFAKNSQAGVLFGATGLNNVYDDNVKPAGATNIGFGNAPNLMYLWACVENNKLLLKADPTAADGTTQNVKTVASANLPISAADTEITLKIQFTKAGDIKIDVNGTNYINLTAAELTAKGGAIYGKEVGIVSSVRHNLAANAPAGELLTFKTEAGIVPTPPATETSDFTVIFAVISVATVLLLAAFCVANKRRNTCK